MDTSHTQGEEIMKAIIAEWGLENFPPEKQIEMVDKIGDLVYQSILLKAVDMLDEVGQAEFDALVDGPDVDATKVLAFFGTKIPDFNALIDNEVKMIKERTVDLV